jgi:ankyrin repeat protein
LILFGHVLTWIAHPALRSHYYDVAGVAVSHPGNVRLRELAEQSKPLYRTLRNSEKASLAKSILDAWRNQTVPPGRVFWKFDGRWQEVEESAAVDIVMTMLRRDTNNNDKATTTSHARDPTAVPAPAPAATSVSSPSGEEGGSNVEGASGAAPASKRQRRPAPREDGGGQRPTGKSNLFAAIGQNYSLDGLEHILRSDPGAIRRRDAEGRLPLHVAACSDAPLEVVRLLADFWDGALRERDNQGKLPLHVAVALERGVVRLSVVRFLVDRYEHALRERNAYGRLPLHVAADNGAPLEVVQVLVDKWEQALQEPDKYGKLPLHIAADRGRVRPDVVRYLLDKWEPALQVRDVYGRLPMDCAKGNVPLARSLISGHHGSHTTIHARTDDARTATPDVLNLAACDNGRDETIGDRETLEEQVDEQNTKGAGATELDETSFGRAALSSASASTPDAGVPCPTDRGDGALGRLAPEPPAHDRLPGEPESLAALLHDYDSDGTIDHSEYMAPHNNNDVLLGRGSKFLRTWNTMFHRLIWILSLMSPFPMPLQLVSTDTLETRSSLSLCGRPSRQFASLLDRIGPLLPTASLLPSKAGTPLDGSWSESAAMARKKSGERWGTPRPVGRCWKLFEKQEGTSQTRPAVRFQPISSR